MTARSAIAPLVYRLFDADDELLYVGSGAVFNRIYNHSISTQWFKQVVRAEIEPRSVVRRSP